MGWKIKIPKYYILRSNQIPVDSTHLNGKWMEPGKIEYLKLNTFLDCKRLYMN